MLDALRKSAAPAISSRRPTPDAWLLAWMHPGAAHSSGEMQPASTQRYCFVLYFMSMLTLASTGCSSGESQKLFFFFLRMTTGGSYNVGVDRRPGRRLALLMRPSLGDRLQKTAAVLARKKSLKGVHGKFLIYTRNRVFGGGSCPHTDLNTSFT